MARKSVALVYTGGTLGMVPSVRGYAASQNLRELLQAKIPELGGESLPDYELTTFGEPTDSADFTPRHWYDLASFIRQQAAQRDGIVVIHGTDTMAYTASALSFLLADLDIPVVLTGSQLPLGELRSDARTNLLTAMEVSVSGRISEVCVCFGHGVLRGNRTTKVHSVAFDAFASTSFPELASVGADVGYRDVEAPAALPPELRRTVPHRSTEIVVLPVYPGLDAPTLRAIAHAHPDAMVLECYGSGTFLSRDQELLAAMRDLVQAGTVVVALSQCLTGGADLSRYAAGRALLDVGVVSGLDMTREAAYTKLHFLHAHGLKMDVVITYLTENLCGEISATPVRDG